MTKHEEIEMRNRNRVIGTVLAVASSAAFADVVTVSAGAAGNVGGTPIFESPAIHTAGLEQFDSSLGTLTGVDLTIHAWHDGVFEFTNLGTTASYQVQWIDYSFEVNGFGGSGGNLLFEDWVTEPSLPNDPFGTAPGHFNTGPTFIDVAAGETAVETFGTYLDFADSYGVGDSEFSQFIGDGTLDFEIVDWAVFSVFAFGALTEWSLDSEAGFTVEATYSYTPVPTPGALSMLAVSGLVATRRRR